MRRTLLLALAFAPCAGAQVENPANGHWYDVMPLAAAISWDDAAAQAAQINLLGAQGHLVTFSDVAEEAFFLSQFGGPGLDLYFIGAYQDLNAPDYSEPGGGWRWITGETFAYANWSAGEPNDAGGNEHHAAYNTQDAWNDLPGDFAFVRGYAIEWDVATGTSYCVATTNSSGSPASIWVSGSASVADGWFVLRAAPVPLFQTGLFFYGPEQLQQPFGNGFRCVGPGSTGVARLAIEPISPQGELQHILDFDAYPTAATQIVGGSTWNFQAWFRDPVAGGANFNLSDAIEVTFTP